MSSSSDTNTPINSRLKASHDRGQLPDRCGDRLHFVTTSSSSNRDSGSVLLFIVLLLLFPLISIQVINSARLQRLILLRTLWFFVRRFHIFTSASSG
ncbi:hypothetical protein PF005_g32234 [Phytophthora fragariae]|uniref:Uncharacterized protein n=1 Tax=Phytophthora fragariae TaxID=53985 RepID=A0A6A3V594_9STRA|nr:hypothetical protein PF003_g39458 [Phytophthora fragariae]KAE8917446.1 hypothetical protein PF009_g32231 [Phytophthora fragariae]KAE8951763.1 hypothetical protein PF011_g32882 [Phytophthora fragariae]KAE9054368.1 hypothetical protein PF007_g32662 [Phytophthora fragariae]KAE9058461.1 hypothetical protein PF006_g32142 [Phytophthora fragariae]